MFRRLHPRDAYPGTGMELAICKKIVELNGAKYGWNQNWEPEALSFLCCL